jgi:hypothetical protein
MEEVISSCEPHKNLDIFREGSVAEWHKCDLARWGGHVRARKIFHGQASCGEGGGRYHIVPPFL